MTELLTAKDVASRLGISEDQVKRRTSSEGWPCVRFSKRTIRYRDEHIDQIIDMHEAQTKVSASGQTARSRSRA